LSREYAVLEDALLGAVRRATPTPVDDDLERPLGHLFDAQLASRHLDALARDLQSLGEAFYTIGSSGHESNAAVAAALRPTDPALLHYRSGAFYCARAEQAGVDAVSGMIHSLTSSAADPISGGRHKVFGHSKLAVIPTTSTIASHLPRAVGLAFGLARSQRLEVEHDWPDDAIVVASFGDASVNHSTAQGAFNAAGHVVRQGLPLPLLLVCEDNGLGISVPSPRGWVAKRLSSLPGLSYVAADGFDAVATLAAAQQAADQVRRTRRPVVLHLTTVRLGGHAGSDAELGYRSPAAIEADRARDPLLGTALALMARGWTADQVLDRYHDVELTVRSAADALLPVERLKHAYQVMSPLTTRRPAEVVKAARRTADARHEAFRHLLPEDAGPLTLAQSINAGLTDLMAARPDVLVFGEDVAVKGGVYGVTKGLQQRFGSSRVFDTLLDEQTVLGTALGTAVAGFLPVPEIQYLAYLHNAEDQLRGEAATLGFFSNAQYGNGMVVRVPGLAYQLGFGGHFHNDNSIGVLRDIPGLVVACPSSAAEAPGLLRTLVGLATAERRVCVFLEPIARYHDKDVAAPYQPPSAWVRDTPELGATALHGTGRDLLIVTFGNGVGMSQRAAERARVDATVLDLRWLAPLPMPDVVAHARSFPRVVVVDETRRSGGVSEGVVTGLVDGGYSGRIDRVTSRDSLIPLGPAAFSVLLSEDDIIRTLRK